MIDFTQFLNVDQRFLSGKAAGEAAARNLNVALEFAKAHKAGEVLAVRFPDDMTEVTSSYTRAFFEPAVAELGDFKTFYAMLDLQAPPWLERAMR